MSFILLQLFSIQSNIGLLAFLNLGLLRLSAFWFWFSTVQNLGEGFASTFYWPPYPYFPIWVDTSVLSVNCLLLITLVVGLFLPCGYQWLICDWYMPSSYWHTCFYMTPIRRPPLIGWNQLSLVNVYVYWCLPVINLM